jgi:adenylate kinase family enzyme
MQKRIQGRLASSPGRVDDSPEAVEKRLQSYEVDTLPVLKYYTPIGRVRKIDAEKSGDEVYVEAKRFTCCRFVYLLGPPGAPVAQVADKLEAKYGYSAISLTTLLQQYAKSDGQDADKVRQSLAKGKAVDASIACPLLVSEIFRDMALGVQNFVLCDFPQSLNQAKFLENRIPCITKPMLLDFTRADAEDLAATAPGDALEMEMRSMEFYGESARSCWRGQPCCLDCAACLVVLQVYPRA